MKGIGCERLRAGLDGSVRASDAEEVLRGVPVLIVEDCGDARELYGVVFASSGAIVHLADSAEEAFDLFVSTRPWVVVSDVCMPGASGLDLVRQIRTVAATPLRCIAVSALEGPIARRLARDAGFDAYLVKPVTPATLRGTVIGQVRDLRSTEM